MTKPAIVASTKSVCWVSILDNKRFWINDNSENVRLTTRFSGGENAASAVPETSRVLGTPSVCRQTHELMALTVAIDSKTVVCPPALRAIEELSCSLKQ